jgi:predicted metalloprotease
MSGAQFVPPRLIAFSGSTTSPCSGNAPSSFYCSANRTIYMDAGTDVNFYRRYGNVGYQVAWKRADMSNTMAHEYGHHLQHLTGILRAKNNIKYELSGDKALEVSRRTELQATCFGTVFLGANRSSYRLSGEFKRQLDYLHAHSGDEYSTVRDHGSRAVQPRWANAGFVTRNPGSCNTFVASPRYVR